MCQWILERISPMILSHESWSVYLFCWLPRVIGIWVALPVNEVLKGACSSVESVINDVFHFVLRFSSDKVRWWPRVVGAMGLVFMIRGQE